MDSLIFAAIQGLTVREILSDLPTDAGAVITFILIALFIGFIWHGSRSGSKRQDSTGD